MGEYAPRSPDLSGVSIPHQDHSDLWGSPAQPFSLGGPKQEGSEYLNQPQAYPPAPPPHHHQHQHQHQPDWFGPAYASGPAAPMHDPFAPQQLHQPKVESKPEPEEYKPYPGELEGTQIKTKFPVARIKRIVQADEDVGKVAQVTPVVVSKALELFMTSLALNAAAVARSRGSKRVTGAHLKLAVAQDDQFDFLQDIVEKIPDPPAASSARGPDDGGDKKSRAKGKKKKDSSEDDDDELMDNDFDDKPKQKRKGAATRVRRKRADDSD